MNIVKLELLVFYEFLESVKSDSVNSISQFWIMLGSSNIISIVHLTFTGKYFKSYHA